MSRGSRNALTVLGARTNPPPPRIRFSSKGGEGGSVRPSTSTSRYEPWYWTCVVDTRPETRIEPKKYGINPGFWGHAYPPLG